MIAAVGDGGLAPVVWGLGETIAEAMEDAERSSDAMDPTVGRWDSNGTAFVAIPRSVANRIHDGEVNCHALGIDVRCDRDGRIQSAEVRS